MNTKIIVDAYGKSHLVSLKNIIHISTGGGVYNAANTNLFIDYGFDQVISVEIEEVRVNTILQEIQDVLEEQLEG